VRRSDSRNPRGPEHRSIANERALDRYSASIDRAFDRVLTSIERTHVQKWRRARAISAHRRARWGDARARARVRVRENAATQTARAREGEGERARGREVRDSNAEVVVTRGNPIHRSVARVR
jgi:hypothetical protein